MQEENASRAILEAARETVQLARFFYKKLTRDSELSRKISSTVRVAQPAFPEAEPITASKAGPK